MMRCVVQPAQIQHGVAWLDARQTRHLVTVRRLRVGDEVIIVADGLTPSVAVIEQLKGRQAAARLLKPAVLPAPEPWAITLAVAIPRRPAAFDQLVDQATQLGVAMLIPMITARSIVQVARTQAANRPRRWQQVATAAAQQSGRSTVPTIAPITPFTDILGPRPAQGSSDCMLLPTVGAGQALHEVVRPGAASRFLILVGPEGDFTLKEIAQATAAGACPISLGPLVLRCETAAMAALAMLLQIMRTRS